MESNISSSLSISLSFADPFSLNLFQLVLIWTFSTWTRRCTFLYRLVSIWLTSQLIAATYFFLSLHLYFTFLLFTTYMGSSVTLSFIRLIENFFPLLLSTIQLHHLNFSSSLTLSGPNLNFSTALLQVSLYLFSGNLFPSLYLRLSLHLFLSCSAQSPASDSFCCDLSQVIWSLNCHCYQIILRSCFALHRKTCK